MNLSLLGKLSGVLSFVLCLAAGLWVLASVGFDTNGDDGVWTGMGLYFVGKAFFVGPMLILAARQLEVLARSSSRP